MHFVFISKRQPIYFRSIVFLWNFVFYFSFAFIFLFLFQLATELKRKLEMRACCVYNWISLSPRCAIENSSQKVNNRIKNKWNKEKQNSVAIHKMKTTDNFMCFFDFAFCFFFYSSFPSLSVLSFLIMETENKCWPVRRNGCKMLGWVSERNGNNHKIE